MYGLGDTLSIFLEHCVVSFFLRHQSSSCSYLVAMLQVSGQKFYYLRNAAALLELALVNWTMTKVRRWSISKTKQGEQVNPVSTDESGGNGIRSGTWIRMRRRPCSTRLRCQLALALPCRLCRTVSHPS